MFDKRAMTGDNIRVSARLRVPADTAANVSTEEEGGDGEAGEGGGFGLSLSLG